VRMWSFFSLTLAVALSARAAEPSFNLDGGGTAPQVTGDRVFVIRSADELALKGISGKGADSVKKVVERVCKENPASTRFRVRCGTGTEGSTRWTYVYPQSVAPLDAEDRPHGSEWLALEGDPAIGSISSFRLVPWKNGIRDGVEKEFSEGHPEAKLVGEVTWRNGKMHGARKAFFPDGRLRSEIPYVDGVADGPARIWDAGGKLLSEGTMKAGKRHGPMTEYWPGTDQPQRIIHYKDDRIDGLVREFYQSGKLKRERSFRNESPHGEDRSFNENGEVASLRYWHDGDPVSKEECEKRSLRKQEK